MPDPLSITILKQGWLVESEAEFDLCSHGRINLTIGGRQITRDEDEYGISEGALALLRTLVSDHSPENPVAEKLIGHGCGLILMMSCPIGVDFTVHHSAGAVTISDIVRYDTTNEAEAVKFPGVSATMPVETYRAIVLGFARQAKQLFEGSGKRFGNEFDENEYREFWVEFDGLVTRFEHDA